MTPEALDDLLDGLPAASLRLPSSTCRFQLHRTFTFSDLAALVPYLARLGVGDCYLSPFLVPTADDSHGYDVADHGRLNPALGGEAQYEVLADALRSHGMGHLVDIVPNHMGIAGSRNVWWMDVLENGPASPYAAFFDIDWDPLKPELKGKVLFPILGEQYGRALENQDLVLGFEGGAFTVRYHDTALPVAPETYPKVLRTRLWELEAALGAEHPHLVELHSILTALAHLPAQTETGTEKLAERQREKQVIKRRLDALAQESRPIRTFIEDTLRLFNGVRGDPRSFDRLDDLLTAQPYRLAFWQVAGDEINYRRFFDINQLAAIRVEEPAVFEETHRLLFRLVREGKVTGFRIDHPDGLYAPARYLRNLQQRCLLETARRLQGQAAEAPPPEWERALLAEADRRVALAPRSPLARPFYVVVEKILTPGEALPGSWPVHGTTGYEFLTTLDGIFIDPAGERGLDDAYARFIGGRLRFPDVVFEAKKLIMDTTMSSEIAMLGHRLARLSERERASRDFTDKSLTDALREVIACFPVYRTYIGEDGEEAGEGDRRRVAEAVSMARRRNPTTPAPIFDFIRDVLSLRLPDGAGERERRQWLHFVMRFQQLTGPVTAKGVEDTAFYRYHRLISLNEVGGAPDRFGVPMAEFHRLNADRMTRWPGALSATSTHDTKRGEDVRARLAVLSEIPREWSLRVRRWQRLNRRKRIEVDGQPVPDANEEYYLYQTLLGAWPPDPAPAAELAEFPQRIRQHMGKALREAKVHTSWVTPYVEYEEAVDRFVEAVLDPSRGNRFLSDLFPFQRRVARAGMYNSLSQAVLKIASPGVPDIYQGAELWDLRLVDPDNRRPVDWSRRERLLKDLEQEILAAHPDLAALAGRLLAEAPDGRIKLYVIHRTLTYRREHLRLFQEGEYLPLVPVGPRAGHLCAFARRLDAEAAVVVAPRLLARFGLEGPPVGGDVWRDTWIPVPAAAGGRYRNLYTGEVLQVASREEQPGIPADAALASFPVALLVRENGGGR